MNYRSMCAALVAALLLSGCSSGACVIFCHNETEIQNDYVVARNECQDTAQSIVGGSPYFSSSSTKDRNAALLESFAKCMKQQGWGVTSPKKTNSRPGGPNDNTTLSGDPWAPTPYGIQQPQTARSAAAQQQGYPPQAYGYQQQPQQAYAPSYSGGYYNPQQGYAPQQQSYAPAPQQGYAQPQGYYGQPQPYSHSGYGYGAANQPSYDSYYGGYGYEGDTDVSEPVAPNRAGIGLAPGFGN